MCGVVSYFGDEPGAVSCIVTGMSAIIYRAPDSTGIGMFGNLTEPVALRKCLGSVVNMMDVFFRAPFHDGGEQLLRAMGPHAAVGHAEMQKKLIQFQGLPLKPFVDIMEEKQTVPDHHGVKSLFQMHGIPGLMGRSGKIGAMPIFTIRSRNDFRAMINSLLLDYNLSSVAVKSLLQDQLTKKLNVLMSRAPVAGDTGNGPLSQITKTDVYGAFDYLFLKTVEELRPVSELREDLFRVHINPHAKKTLWLLIASMQITIPKDFDRDGIKHLFRTIDGAILSHVPSRPKILEDLQQRLHVHIKNLPPETLSPTFVPEKQRAGGHKTHNESAPSASPDLLTPDFDWLTLYASERALNVFGRASVVAFEWACDHRLGPLSVIPAYLKKPESLAAADNTHHRATLPKSLPPHVKAILDYLPQPIIGHGRWALQSSVTVNNAHPFSDGGKQRLIALNGQFSADIEEEMRTFLTQVAGLSLRTDNSGEYLALFWGYYFNFLHKEKKRFQEIEQQIELDLDVYGAGNNTINYQIFKQVQKKDMRELDEMAFIKAVSLFTQKGGQIAVTGISMASPETLYAAACNRPLFVVKRVDKDDYMVVSDANAALGLFTQREILSVSRDYDTLISRRDSELKALPFSPDLKTQWEKRLHRYDAEIEAALNRLKVEMYVLDGKDLFAKIETRYSADRGVFRELTIMDLAGNLVHDIEPERFNLTPPHVHKDLDRSFFESHMQQIPELLEAQCSAVFEEGAAMNPIQLNRGALERRFGPDMGGLKRIILTGMGSSNYTGLSCVPFFRKHFPDLQIISMKPVEVSILSRQIYPEQDLVLLASWSGTTADMVDFAKKLQQTGTLCISVTEKIVGDLALITRKSGGVIHTMSGEEVTIPAIKSTFCMAMALHLFALWFKENYKKIEPSHSAFNDLKQIPHTLRKMLTDDVFTRDIEAVAFDNAAQKSVTLIGDLPACGTDLDAALKFEEMSRYLKARSVDYAEIPSALLNGCFADNQVIVTATHPQRIGDALCAMEKLSRSGVDFMALTWEGRDLDKIQKVCNRVVVVPRCDESLQHFVDLIFYYQLAFFSGRARGQIDDNFPRNRAKSVTTSRSTPLTDFMPKNELFNIRHRETLFPPSPAPAEDLDEKTRWEEMHFTPPTQALFTHLKQIARALRNDAPLNRLIAFQDMDINYIAGRLFNDHGPRHICFRPLDLPARAAARKTLSVLSRFFPCSMRCADGNEGDQGLTAQTLVIHISSRRNVTPHEKWNNRTELPQVWVCPATTSTGDAGQFMPGIPRINYLSTFDQVDDCLIYTTLMVLLLTAWREHNSAEADLVMAHFKRSHQVIFNILNHTPLADQIQRVSRRNLSYKSLLYLSPADGSGISFTRRFDTASSCFSQWQPFGNSAHGPLVTVDSDVEAKYIRLAPREQMIALYGEEKIIAWENTYLQGVSVDAVLDKKPDGMDSIVNAPFYNQDHWYLPLLRPDYDPSLDNLVVLDAANEFYFEQAIDDLTVFGSRHSRMILISQDSLIHAPEKKALKKFPLSGMILLPSMPGEDRPVPLSDCHLPFATALIAAVMADYWVSPE